MTKNVNQRRLRTELKLRNDEQSSEQIFLRLSLILCRILKTFQLPRNFHGLEQAKVLNVNKIINLVGCSQNPQYTALKNKIILVFFLSAPIGKKSSKVPWEPKKLSSEVGPPQVMEYKVIKSQPNIKLILYSTRNQDPWSCIYNSRCVSSSSYIELCLCCYVTVTLGVAGTYLS